MRYEIAIELKKSKKAGCIEDQFRDWPMAQEVVFQHGREISISGKINTNKLESLGEKWLFFRLRVRQYALQMHS